jgi:hypothetical protein
MRRTRLILKQSSVWFAAGREFAAAIGLLSDGAFKLYVYLCLHADRFTACITTEVDQLAAAMGKDREMVEMQLLELQRQGVCYAPIKGSLEVSDRFWPYEKQKADHCGAQEEAQFVRRVRDLFLEPACVEAVFTPADAKFAATLHIRRISLEHIHRAILLGCARKYIAMINHQVRQPITSLQYFAAVIDEVEESAIPESYWEHLRRKMQQMESVWLGQRAPIRSKGQA